MTTTTLTALQAGSVTYKLVAAIEGYPWLFTDATSTQALNAWTGLDWSQAITGLVADLQNSQELNPWDPLQGGGTLTLYVPPDAGDQFGIDTHRTAGGVETNLTATLTRSTTTITVGSTTNFPASGEAYVGTETFSYSGKGANTFTGCVRGKYSPFAAYGTGAPRFSHDHRYGYVDYSTQLAPVVSSQPRIWIGRWVGLWVHRLVDGVLDLKAQAHLVFAGKIAELRDDPTTLHTVVQVRNVLDVIKESVVGRDQWTAEAIDGMHIDAGMTWTMTDSHAALVRTANPLTCVASGASGANQVDAGYYTLQDIYSFLNAWWASEVHAGRLYGNYYTILTNTTSNGLRAKIYWNMGALGGAAGDSCYWHLTSPYQVSAMLGFGNVVHINDSGTVLTDYHLDSSFAPSNTPVFSGSSAADLSVQFERESGVFVDNLAYLPAGLPAPSPTLGLQWGVFLLDNKRFFVAAKVGTQLLHCYPIAVALGGLDPINDALANYSRPIDAIDVTPIQIKQVYVIQASMAAALKLLFYNTGTAGYNHPTYDVLGFGFGVGLPGGVLGAAFDASVDALPGADKQLLMIIEKPSKLGGTPGGSDSLISADLVLRRAFPIWKDGGLQFTCWQTPTTANAIATLDDTTKAAPAGNQEDHRSVTTLTNQWQKDIVKIEYARDITQLSGTTYTKFITLEDSVSIDDAGGEGSACTISARNSYGQYAATGTGIEELAPSFLASFPLFSRAMRLMRRSIDPRFYYLAPGDVVTVSDKFARDPSTGQRQITARPGVIVRIQYTLGGPTPGKAGVTRAMTGEIDIVFLERNLIAGYAPSARVDDTFTSGGYTNGYNNSTSTLRCKTHEYSEASESLDASNFAAGDKITITELDPAVSASPITWSRVISSVSSSDIALTAALSAPAFDTTKKYGVTYDHYAIAQTSQQVKSFQADTDFLIENLAPPDQYALTTSTAAFTASVHTDLPELPADQSYGDGKAFDVGNDKNLSRLVNNLHDHKTRHNAPVLTNTVMTNTTYSAGGGFQLLAIEMVHLTTEMATTNTNRYLKVAPWFRSSDGTAVTFRLTLTKYMPTGSSINDVTRTVPYIDATWTTSSTIWQQGAETLLPCSVKDQGIGFLLIEMTIKGETRGLAQCNEGERVVL